MSASIPRSRSSMLLRCMLAIALLCFAASSTFITADAFTQPAVVKIGAVLPITGQSAEQSKRNAQTRKSAE